MRRWHYYRHARARSFHTGGAEKRDRLGYAPIGKNCWGGKPTFITGTSGGAIGTALAQQHLRSIMLSVGTIIQGGDVYVTFKPNLVDDDGNISDDSTRKFLQGAIDQFASLVTRLAPQPARTT